MTCAHEWEYWDCDACDSNEEVCRRCGITATAALLVEKGRRITELEREIARLSTLIHPVGS